MATSRSGKMVRVVLGLVVGAAIAEGAFHLRDHGAFPHLNVYVADPELGVRLRPDAREKIAFGGNPVTSIHIGADGLRGDLPAVASQGEEMLVVGDSQVFGLGVEEDDTFSARLGAQLHRTVVNAGVPTYGPLEYESMLETWIEKRHAKTVVYVVNLANDLTEAKRPNKTRHAEWDGWAVRKETAPDSVVAFPGRTLLFRESHAVFAFRRLWHGEGRGDEQPLPSEGNWRDLVTEADAQQKAQDTAEKQAIDAWAADLDDATKRVTADQAKLESEANAAFPEVFKGPEGKEYLAKHGRPGDIVTEHDEFQSAEAGPTIKVRVKVLIEGATVRQAVESTLRARAQAQIDREEAKAILSTLEDRKKIEEHIKELRALPARLVRMHSPMAPHFEHAQAACKKAGARLLVVVLPMDVQVSAREWRKYGQVPLELGPVKILVEDVVRAASETGIEVLDPTDALFDAEPGAFLSADLHMSAKGHRALADVIGKTLSAPPVIAPPPPPPPALGFTRVCACHKQVRAAVSCKLLPERPDLDCLRKFPDDCAKLLECVVPLKKADGQ